MHSSRYIDKENISLSVDRSDNRRINETRNEEKDWGQNRVLWGNAPCWSPEVGVIAASDTSENYVMDQSVFDAPVTFIEPCRSLDRH